MTREHKLAVVLGFGLLLFVGILVSDHFSASQRRVSTALAARTPVRESRSSEPVSIQAIQYPQQAIAPVMPRGHENGVLPGQMIVAHPTADVGVPAELYTLKDGETLYKICQSKYGNGNLWKELAEFNKGTVSNPTKLRKGMTLRLPSVHVLKGEVTSPSPAAVAPMVPVPGGAVFPAEFVQSGPASAEREYIVQKGDTLGAIASREMGSAKKWNQLFEANKDRLKSPTDLKIGKPLRIPADS